MARGQSGSPSSALTLRLSLCSPSCTVASCSPHAWQRPQNPSFPPLSWVFLSQSGRGTITPPHNQAFPE